MFCRNCGKEIPDQVRFCPACGCQVKNISAVPMQSVEIRNQSEDQQPVNNQSQVTSQTVVQQPENVLYPTMGQPSGQSQSSTRKKVRDKWKLEAGIVNIIAGVFLFILGIVDLTVEESAMAIIMIGIVICSCGIFHLCNLPMKVEALTKMICGILAFLLGIIEVGYCDSLLTPIAGGICLFVSGLVLLVCKNKKDAGNTEFWLGVSLNALAWMMEITYGDFFAAVVLSLVMIANGGTRWSFWRRKFENEKMKK